MSDDEIFDLDKTRDRARLQEADAAASIGGLDALVGRRRTTRIADGAGHDLPRLVAMVEAAAADRAPMPLVPAPSSTRRPPRRVDWLSVLTGAAAVVAVAVASTFTAVQIANASPAGDAAVLLQSDAESLLSAELGLTASRLRVEGQLQTGLSNAQAFQGALATLAPADDEDPFFDAATVDAANATAAQYIAALQTVALPEELPEWIKPTVDEQSLSSVATAIDEVQARAGLVDGQNSELRSIRQNIENATAGFTAGVDALRAAVGASAQRELDDVSGARQTLRDAVTLAAANVEAADLTTEAGVATLVAYRDAVRALRANQSLAVEEAERQREANANRSTGNRTQTQTPSDPGTETTPPTDPTNPPEQTEPDTVP
ncbi:hypothetical protein SRABI76_02320 [Microbacterium oxydans]|uniref:Uncharacterized protein n=1 Tax=Microbacterium oxydans TaxID=82380 RepID=A0A0F0LCM3_9MICO|nr:hypothetical protein [Microbacterium oxydans]KJL29291.1 hypothetical protein RS83_01920 [Microbacterium oxydans]CAH0213277.1 hypothetical protein SRABI76_02320 [Microbacterium oxydans]